MVNFEIAKVCIKYHFKDLLHLIQKCGGEGLSKYENSPHRVPLVIECSHHILMSSRFQRENLVVLLSVHSMNQIDVKDKQSLISALLIDNILHEQK